MSAFNRQYVDQFLNDSRNKVMLKSLKKFKDVDINNNNHIINLCKLTKNDIKDIYNLLDSTGSILHLDDKPQYNKLHFITSKCFNNFKNDYKGTISTSSNMFRNQKLNLEPYEASFYDPFIKCLNGEEDIHKKIIIMKKKFHTILFNFSAENYSGRSLHSYLFTKKILGEDYDFSTVASNIGNYYHFINNGALKQEIIYYFIEIYMYDRYNFFKNLLKSYQPEEIIDLSNHNTDIILQELFKNKHWIREYPPINGVIYMDHHNINLPVVKKKYTLEIVLYCWELYFDVDKEIPITEQIFNDDTKKNFFITQHNLSLPINNHIYVNKYIKYKKKYLQLKNQLNKS